MSEITVYVDPDATGSADGSSWADAYNSLNAAEAAKQGDYVSDTDNYVYLCRSSGSTADNTAVIIDGSITNATYNIRVKSDDDHQGKWNSSLYRLALANANIMTVQDSWTVIEGIQIELTGQNANYQICLIAGAISSGTYVYIDSCIFKSSNSSSYRERCVSLGPAAGRNVAFYNNVIWNVNDDPASVANSALHIDSGTINLHNNTFSGGYNNVYIVGGTVNAYNNIFKGAANAVSFGSWNNADYNASDKGTTTGGGNDITSATFSFDDDANGDFHLADADSSGAKNGGTDDPGSGLYSDDFEGDTRVSSWDIGADEYIAAASGNPWYYYVQQ